MNMLVNLIKSRCIMKLFIMQAFKQLVYSGIIRWELILVVVTRLAHGMLQTMLMDLMDRMDNLRVVSRII